MSISKEKVVPEIEESNVSFATRERWSSKEEAMGSARAVFA